MAFRNKASKTKVTSAEGDNTKTIGESLISYVTQSSTLLSLPKEVQNRIIALVCRKTSMQYQRRSGLHRRGRAHFDGLPEPPGCILACKQLYYESIEVSFNYLL